jgi:hypothetical protein
VAVGDKRKPPVTMIARMRRLPHEIGDKRTPGGVEL